MTLSFPQADAIIEQLTTRVHELIGTEYRDVAVAAADRAVADANRAATAADTAEEAKQIATNLPTTIQNELDTRVPPMVHPLVASAIADDQTIVDAARAAAPDAVAAIADETIRRGTGESSLSSSTVLEDLPPGRYQCAQTAVATNLGLPEGMNGTLLVDWLDPSGIYRRHKYEIGNAGERKVYRNTAWNGAWRGWKLEFDAAEKVTPYLRGAIPSGVTPDTMMGSEYDGVWYFSSGHAADWEIPSNAAGFLEVWSSGFSTLQEIKTMTTPVEYHHRRAYNGNWSYNWERLGASEPEPESQSQSVGSGAVDDLAETVWSPTDYKADHYALIEEMRDRIGPVTTGGTGAFALVFDHGTTAVKEWAWEACRSRGIPVTMALCPGVHFGPGADSNHQATVEDVQGWVDEGMVLASHSWDHDGATGYTEIHREIVESRRVLEEMFGVPVDSWVQPGYVLSNGNYGGFGSGQYASRYTDTFAGQLLQRTYPVITGYVGDEYVYPLSPNPVVGIQRSLIERIGTIDTSKAYVQEAIDTGGKHIVFIHPYALAKDSSATYHTRAEFEGFLDWIVAQRDAGDLQPMTLPELSIAAADTATVPDSQTYEPDTGYTLPQYAGTGFPEGKVTAPVGAIYTDSLATAGAVRWIKTSGTGATGWALEYGDTGWRNITANNQIFGTVGEGGAVTIRRSGDVVTFRLLGPIIADDRGRFEVRNISYRFTPAMRLYLPMATFDGQFKPQVTQYHFQIGGQPAGQTIVRSNGNVEFTWTTTAAWPTTLPGTPV